MEHYIQFALLAFTSFFTLINPLGVMPVFMSMTSSLDNSQRKSVAIKAIITSFTILMIFAISGQLLFNFFSITVDSFRVVGGILFFMMGYDMLQARISKTKFNSDEEKKSYGTDIAITPLGIPMITGPGAITNSIVLMEDASTWGDKIILVVSILLVMAITLTLLLFSSKIMKLMGETGNKVMMRIMGLIVMVIAVEFFFSGMKPIIQGIFKIA